jgi:hypothetical protein
MTRKSPIRRGAAPASEAPQDIAASLRAASRPQRRGGTKSWRTVLLEALVRPAPRARPPAPAKRP